MFCDLVAAGLKNHSGNCGDACCDAAQCTPFRPERAAITSRSNSATGAEAAITVGAK